MIDNRKDIDIRKRIGKFNIVNIINDPLQRKILSLLFSKVIIVEATMKFFNNSIEYVALSEHFFEIDEGTYPPLYRIIVEDNSKIIFQRIEDNKVVLTVVIKNYILDRLEKVGQSPLNKFGGLGCET